MPLQPRAVKMTVVEMTLEEVKLTRAAIVNLAQQQDRSLTQDEAALLKRLDVAIHDMARGPRFNRPHCHAGSWTV